MHGRLLAIVSALWVASEFFVGLLKGKRGDLTQHDRGTLPILWLGTIGSVAAAIFLRAIRAMRMPPAWTAPAFWTGLALILLGVALRWTAIYQLRRFFSVAITIRPDHELVDRGLYAVLRHPSYTGSIVSFIGLGFAFGSWASVAVLFLGPLLAFAYRIRVEERVLTAHFGDAYRAYAARTKRLIPGIF